MGDFGSWASASGSTARPSSSWAEAPGRVLWQLVVGLEHVVVGQEPVVVGQKPVAIGEGHFAVEYGL